MKILPLGERVVIKRIEAEEKTKSGIVLPTQAQEKPQIAEVIEVGNLEDSKIKLEINNKVLFKQYSGTDVKLDGIDYILIDAKDILAVVK